jgi:hypothetical protein
MWKWPKAGKYIFPTLQILAWYTETTDGSLLLPLSLHVFLATHKEGKRIERERLKKRDENIFPNSTNTNHVYVGRGVARKTVWDLCESHSTKIENQ